MLHILHAVQEMANKSGYIQTWGVSSRQTFTAYFKEQSGMDRCVLQESIELSCIVDSIINLM